MVPPPHLLPDLSQISITHIHILNFSFSGYEQASIIIMMITTTTTTTMMIDKIETNKPE